jgi:hypothetical protein
MEPNPSVECVPGKTGTFILRLTGYTRRKRGKVVAELRQQLTFAKSVTFQTTRTQTPCEILCVMAGSSQKRRDPAIRGDMASALQIARKVQVDNT